MSARKNLVYRPRPMSLESVAISRGFVGKKYIHVCLTIDLS